jgi:hypothetical protein
MVGPAGRPPGGEPAELRSVVAEGLETTLRWLALAALLQADPS